jgi:hypothetical protein
MNRGNVTRMRRLSRMALIDNRDMPLSALIVPDEVFTHILVPHVASEAPK